MFSLVFLSVVLFPFAFTGLIYGIFRLKNRPTRENLLRLKMVLFCFVAALGHFTFFKDKQVVFECRKPSLNCAYYHSTIADPELRFVRSYDLKGLKSVELRTKKHRNRPFISGKFYKIVFHLEKEPANFPETFEIEDRAKKEIADFNRFLETDEQSYVYQRGNEENDDFERGISFSFYLTAGAWLVWILRGRKKETDRF